MHAFKNNFLKFWLCLLKISFPSDITRFNTFGLRKCMVYFTMITLLTGVSRVFMLFILKVVLKCYKIFFSLVFSASYEIKRNIADWFAACLNCRFVHWQFPLRTRLIFFTAVPVPNNGLDAACTMASMMIYSRWKIEFTRCENAGSSHSQLNWLIAYW